MPILKGYFFDDVRRGWVRLELLNADIVEIRRDVFADFGFEGLRNGDLIEDENLAAAIDESGLRHGKSVALRFLRERPRSMHEIRCRLMRDHLDPKTIDVLITRLSGQNLLNDAEFARAWVGSRIGLRPKGIFLIRHELRGKGVEEDLIDAALSYGYPGELEVARPLVDSRAALLAGQSRSSFRQKLGAYLKRRGFSGETIVRLVDESWHSYGHNQPDL